MDTILYISLSRRDRSPSRMRCFKIANCAFFCKSLIKPFIYVDLKVFCCWKVRYNIWWMVTSCNSRNVPIFVKITFCHNCGFTFSITPITSYFGLEMDRWVFYEPKLLCKSHHLDVHYISLWLIKLFICEMRCSDILLKAIVLQTNNFCMRIFSYLKLVNNLHLRILVVVFYIVHQ